MLLSNKDDTEDPIIKKTGSMEAMIERADDTTEDRDKSEMSIEKVITELDDTLNARNFYGKSRLSFRKRRGLYKARGFIIYMWETYKVRSEVLEEVVWSITHWEISADGQGRKESSDIVAAGTPKLDVKTGLDFSERVFGGGLRR